MEGQHITVLPMVVGNLLMVNHRNNTSEELTGVLPLMISWMALKFNFSYSYTPDAAPERMRDLPNRKGAINKLETGAVDLALGAIYPAATYFKKIDVTTSWMHSTLGLLIPWPRDAGLVNISAIAQPFTLQVWIMILVAFLTILPSLYYINRLECNIFQKKFGDFHRFDRVYSYISGVLLQQGSVCHTHRLAIRLVAAVWCFGCFILVQAYSSCLISYLATPMSTKPIINGLNDIPQTPGIEVVVDSGASVELTFFDAKWGVLKYIGDMLLSNPSLRCNLSQDCVDRVLDGRHVYINGDPLLKTIIYEDRKRAGTCRLTIAKQSVFQPSPIVLGLRKASPYVDTLNRGLLLLRENGLIQHWLNKYKHRTDECLNTEKKRPNYLILKLKHLFGAVVCLLFGYCVSSLVFMGEVLLFKFFFCLYVVYPLAKLNFV